MKRFLLVALAFGASHLLGPSVFAANAHFWRVISPDHEQTFAYGTETHRVWQQWGRDRHLTLLLDYTNDPFVDRQNPRQYDNFQFDFPAVRLEADGRTFSYRTPGGRTVPVAVRRPDILGVDEVHLLPNANVVVQLPHGTITVFLDILDQ